MKKSVQEKLPHKLTGELKKIIFSNKKILEVWETVTPLAQNEWICFLLSPKNEETKLRRLDRMKNSLMSGKKRPCCWEGCSHRKKM